LRQSPSREAFHAGHNLRDKGLRYFNTVRVTADVHPWLKAVSCSAYAPQLTQIQNVKCKNQNLSVALGEEYIHRAKRDTLILHFDF